MKRHTATAMILAGTALLVVMGVVPVAAQDFRVIQPGPEPGKAPHEWAPFTHWDLREMPSCAVPWTMGTNPVPDLDDNGTPNTAGDRAAAQAAFAAAFGRWAAVFKTKLKFTNPAGTPTGGFVVDGWNTISFENLPPGVNGATVVSYNVATGRITEADIVLNSSTDSIPGFGIRRWVVQTHGTPCDWDEDNGTQGNWPNAGDGDTDHDGDNVREIEMDLGKTSTHEIGHFIGLSHIVPLGGTSNDPARPIMEQFNLAGIGPTGAGWTNLDLKTPDLDGDNFLYTPDMGDAPDPWMGVFNQYPTLVHKPNQGRILNGLTLDAVALGAEHIVGIKSQQPYRNWTYEWLARKLAGDVTSECEANIVDKDPADDGVTWYPNPPIWGRTMTVKEWIMYASDDASNAHDYPTHPIYGNAWLDVNQNCIWEEHFLHSTLQPPPPVGKNTILQITTTGTIGLPHFVDSSKPVWLRCRVDYGEDVGTVANIDGNLAGPAGAAQYGETEDYPFYCNTRYESVWVCNPFPFALYGSAMVIVGPPIVTDFYVVEKVDQNSCPVTTSPPPAPAYVPSADETIVDCPVPTYVPPFTYMRFGRCRTNDPPQPPMTTARSHFTTDEVPSGTPAMLVPDHLRIPGVNCSYRVFGEDEPNEGMILFTIGAVDFASGGWISGPDPLTHEWEDSIRVTVSYRVSPNLVPLVNLTPCDPIYGALALHAVGTGTVTPEDAFEFMLDMDVDVPPGHRVILEMQCEWSTNSIVANQIVEFPDAFGAPTTVDDSPPSAIALDSYPNPFNPSTTIRYALPEASVVSLGVYDVSGALVRRLVREERRPAGVFAVEWDGTDSDGRRVASGVYFYRMTTEKQTLTRKGVLLK